MAIKGCRLMSYLLLTLLLGLNCGIAKADQALANGQTSAEFRVIVDYFSQFVRDVHRPFALYHWRKDASLVQSIEAQNNPAKFGRKIVEQEAGSFIPGLYSKNRSGNAYGGGLYAALDPVATEKYGGKDPDQWALLTLQIPVGFRLLDLRIRDLNLNYPDASLAEPILRKYGCQMDEYRPNVISGVFASFEIQKTCADLVAKVLAELKIDGFIYPYLSTLFKACDKMIDRSAALVFTSKDWLNLPGAKAWLDTSRTNVDLDRRRAIESQFVYAYTNEAFIEQNNPFQFDMVSKLLRSRFSNLPEQLALFFDNVSCDSDGCIFTVSYNTFSGSGRAYISSQDLKRFFYPSYPANFYVSQEFGMNRLHWNDLAGEPTTPDISKWLRSNLLDCGDASSLHGPSHD